MSDILVPVTRVGEVLPHPNADRLEIVKLEGMDWQVVGQKDTYHVGDPVVYVPPDAVLTEALSDELGVTNYLSKGRVRAVKLRGQPSFGFIFPTTLTLGQDVADFFKITKYEPPIRMAAGDAAAEHPLFPSYTDIENLRNYPQMFSAADEVQITEKIHGTNCRVGWVQGELMAGSHKVRRKEPANYRDSIYWSPLLLDSVQALLDHFRGEVSQVVLYGEVYGRVQKLHYGLPGDVGFVAFDILVNGRFLNPGELYELTHHFGVPMVPVLYFGPYTADALAVLAEGKTCLGGDTHIREGLVVRPLEEHDWEHPRDGLRRAIGKYVSATYLTGGTEDEAHD